MVNNNTNFNFRINNETTLISAEGLKHAAASKNSVISKIGKKLFNKSGGGSTPPQNSIFKDLSEKLDGLSRTIEHKQAILNGKSFYISTPSEQEVINAKTHLNSLKKEWEETKKELERLDKATSKMPHKIRTEVEALKSQKEKIDQIFKKNIRWSRETKNPREMPEPTIQGHSSDKFNLSEEESRNVPVFRRLGKTKAAWNDDTEETKKRRAPLELKPIKKSVTSPDAPIERFEDGLKHALAAYGEKTNFPQLSFNKMQIRSLEDYLETIVCQVAENLGDLRGDELERMLTSEIEKNNDKTINLTEEDFKRETKGEGISEHVPPRTMRELKQRTNWPDEGVDVKWQVFPQYGEGPSGSRKLDQIKGTVKILCENPAFIDYFKGLVQDEREFLNRKKEA